jgi:hypothetical protein
MENANTNHTEQSGTKTAEKIMNNTSKGVMDMYTKNLDLVACFYSNLLGSFLPQSNTLNYNPFSSGFATNDFTKLFSNPFNGTGNGLSNQSLPIFNNVFQQIIDYNANLFSMLSKGMNFNNDWAELGKKEEAIVENRLEATKNMRHSILESYNKQLDAVNENNMKMMQETTDQFNLLMIQNQKLWADMFSMNQTPAKAEEKIIKDGIIKDPILKDPILSEVKKRSGFPVSDHKL